MSIGDAILSQTQTRDLLSAIRHLHEALRSAILATCEGEAIDTVSRISRDSEGDTIYAIDDVGEALLLDILEKGLAAKAPLLLIAEGLPGGRVMLPRGYPEADAVWRIIVDPIDGTRGLMYQKRSAWILTGVARNLGGKTSLADIELAVQTEIPTVKQHLCDTVWAIRGRGAEAERTDRITGERSKLALNPSKANSIAHGFATVSRFFPGTREELAAIDEEIVAAALGPVQRGKAHCFEDQYISTGGQLFELMSGHDRFIADIRPLMEAKLAARGLELGICCHPYDLCTELIARELGVIVTDVKGDPLQAPLDVDTDVAWVGYANDQIRHQVEPHLQDALRKRQLLL